MQSGVWIMGRQCSWQSGIGVALLQPNLKLVVIQRFFRRSPLLQCTCCLATLHALIKTLHTIFTSNL